MGLLWVEETKYGRKKRFIRHLFLWNLVGVLFNTALLCCSAMLKCCLPVCLEGFKCVRKASQFPIALLEVPVFILPALLKYTTSLWNREKKAVRLKTAKRSIYSTSCGLQNTAPSLLMLTLLYFSQSLDQQSTTRQLFSPSLKAQIKEHCYCR